MVNIRESLLLYAVTDRRWLKGMTLAEAVEKVIDGGASFVQLREKSITHDDFVEEAKKILPICRRHGVPLIINDDVEAAVECGADGVHVGQEDMAVVKARKLLGKDKIIGASAHTVEEAVKAQNDGADYLGCGAVFHTGTKWVKTQLTFESIRKITSAVDIPVVAIGGITQENMPLLKGCGAAGVAVVSAIFAADDIKHAAEELKAIAQKTFL